MLRTRCVHSDQEDDEQLITYACTRAARYARTGQRVVGVALHPDPLVDTVGRQNIAAAGQCTACAMHHGEFVAGRRAAHAGLDVPVRRPAHQAAVELGVLDDAAVVQGLHRVAKALQCVGAETRTSYVHLTISTGFLRPFL